MSNPFQARVHRHPDSPFWRARFRIWNAAKQDWAWRTQSTKETDEARAITIANEFAGLAQKAAPGGGRTKLTREDVMDALNAILRISGVPVIRETVGWKSYAETWLETKKDVPAALGAYAGQIQKLSQFLPDPETPLNTITVQDLRKWQASMLTSGRSGKTVNNITATIGAVFKQAVAEGFMPRNPMDLLAKAPLAQKERDTFTLEEIRKLLNHLQETKERDWTTAVLLGLCTGQRLTDCTRALWTHIDKASNPWWVWTLTQKKTGNRVEIPLVEPLATHLRKLDTADSLYLCPSLVDLPTGGNHGLSPTFTKLLEGAGIVGKKVAKKGAGRGWNSKTFHSLRHTCNSIMANAGVSQDVRRKILGHASDTMNTRYTHLEISTSGTALADSIGLSLSIPGATGPGQDSNRQPKRSGTRRRAGTR
jgi:integrase